MFHGMGINRSNGSWGCELKKVCIRKERAEEDSGSYLMMLFMNVLVQKGMMGKPMAVEKAYKQE